MAETRYDVIVIGAGFGGSACAGLLAKQGLKVLLIEKNAGAGGKAMSLSKKGFTYTAWVVISAPIQDNLLKKTLDELGMTGKAELVSFPGQQAAMYRTPSGKYKRMPPMPPGMAMDPNVVFDWLEVPKRSKRSWSSAS